MTKNNSTLGFLHLCKYSNLKFKKRDFLQMMIEAEADIDLINQNISSLHIERKMSTEVMNTAAY